MLEKRHYIRRCHELAILGAQNAAPNPMVGSVIVGTEEIIGEGWHRQYKKEHAEINALNSVQTANFPQLKKSTIFVSLEPCSIFGNTPPCTDAILKAGIENVVVSSRDRTKGVDHISESILKEKELNLTYGIDHELGDLIAASRNIFVSQKRPYIILKWAQSSDGFIARPEEATSISNQYSLRYVHQLRSEVGAIVIGRRTAIIDNPSLTTRYYSGRNPLRIVLGNLDSLEHGQLNLLSDGNPTLIIHRNPPEKSPDHVKHIVVEDNDQIIQTLCNQMFERQIQKILIEGGAATLQSFIDANLWDECRIITNSKALKDGTRAPVFPNMSSTQSFNLMNDRIDVFHNISKT